MFKGITKKTGNPGFLITKTVVVIMLTIVLIAIALLSLEIYIYLKNGWSLKRPIFDGIVLLCFIIYVAWLLGRKTRE